MLLDQSAKIASGRSGSAATMHAPQLSADPARLAPASASAPTVAAKASRTSPRPSRGSLTLCRLARAELVAAMGCARIAAVAGAYRSKEFQKGGDWMRLFIALLMFSALFFSAMAGATLGTEYGAPVVHELIYGY